MLTTHEFHNFNAYFKDNEVYKVVAFTAAQIPGIEERRYPAELAGHLYPQGIPIYSEERLSELIKTYNIDQVILAYSDLAFEDVMNKASLILAEGADFRLMGPKTTMLKSSKPVISIVAVRTGAGKSPCTRKVTKILRDLGLKVSIIRHPMPYGNLIKEKCQKFETFEDLDKYETTIEEREEYEPHIANGFTVFAGVDYQCILEEAEKSGDLIVWDGGNNDFSFYHSDLTICVADAHRPNHEMSYYPGETNFRMADVIIINKVKTAPEDGIRIIKENIERVNASAKVIESASPITVDQPSLIKGQRVLVIEDGPTLTHGQMSYGAGSIAAKNLGAEIIDPRPFAVGSIKEVYEKYTHLDQILPAMGYGEHQIQELEETICNAECDAVVIGTPIDLTRLISCNKPMTRVRYELEEIRGPTLKEILTDFVTKMDLR
ncbi:MAG: cyclic 2,3-diphosphoglycerate synthase [Promethearchaeota archaeon]